MLPCHVPWDAARVQSRGSAVVPVGFRHPLRGIVVQRRHPSHGLRSLKASALGAGLVAFRSRVRKRPRFQAGSEVEDLFADLFEVKEARVEAKPRPWSQKLSEQLRRQMTQAETVEDLKEEIDLALQEHLFDSETAVTAIQHCGQQGWFQQLKETWEVAQSEQLQLAPKQQSAVFASLTSCLRKASDEETKVESLRLAQELWTPVESEEEGNCVLSSGLRLCLALNTEEAFFWAEALWNWSLHAHLSVNIVSYGVWLSLLESKGRFEEVDDLLSHGPLRPNRVILGALLEQHVSDRHWRRAEQLWRSTEVKPNGVAYGSYAKVQFVAGRPGAGVQILEDMLAENADEEDYGKDSRFAVDYLQMLLVVCHSFPSTTNLKRLSGFLLRGAALVQHMAAPKLPLRRSWQQLSDVARRVLQKEPVDLQEVLITWPAQQSIMKDWGKKAFGSGYLWDFAGS